MELAKRLVVFFGFQTNAPVTRICVYNAISRGRNVCHVLIHLRDFHIVKISFVELFAYCPIRSYIFFFVIQSEVIIKLSTRRGYSETF